MTEAYDPSQHLLMIAAIVFYWHLLRIWHQPPPPGPRDKTEGKKATALPLSSFPYLAWLQSPQAVPDTDGPSKPARPAGRAGALTAIRDADARFDEASFLNGASRAYERVVNAYAGEDFATLARLVDPEVAKELWDHDRLVERFQPVRLEA